MRRFLAVPALVGLSVGSLLSAQTQDRPVFRAAAELVEVIVQVSDRDGRFMADLTEADFALEEEGRAQTIAAFNRVDLPRPPAGAVVAAARPAFKAPVRRVVRGRAGSELTIW